MHRRLVYILLVISGILFVSCNSNTSTTTEDEESIPNDSLTLHEKALVGMINGSIYCIPSPYECMLHIQRLKIPFNHSLPNSVMNCNLYESSFKKLLNMGVYGIDVSYLSLYGQVSDALNYFATLKTLANQVELSYVFDANTMERLEDNLENNDSLLVILTRKFHESDKYLKSEHQRTEAALLLTGCWIESLYILSQVQKEKPNEATIQKIAEHKFVAESILDILRPSYEKSDEFKNLIDQIVNICYDFDGVTYEYEYLPATTYSSRHLTIINSRAEFSIMPEHVTMVTEKIEKLRNEIIK